MRGKRHFVVERLNWRPYEEPGYRPGPKAKLKIGSWARLPGSERVASFADAGEAERDRRRREEEARREVNPFACGSALCYLTSLDEGRLRDWVLDLGLTPPEGSGQEAWRAWWAQTAPGMNGHQSEKVWEALDRVRFFRVAEAPKRVLFAVAAAYWKYSDEYYYRESDGYTSYNAYHTREEAEAEREEMEEFARHESDMHPFQINALCRWEAWSSLPEQEAVERVKALGLPPPEPWKHGFEWEDWWDRTEMSYSQRDAVWDLLDRIRFWEVIEVEMPD